MAEVFVRELSADPIAWLAVKLSDLPEVLKEAGVSADIAAPGDAESLRRAVPDILEATERLLGRVRSGELGNAPAGSPATTSRQAGSNPWPIVMSTARSTCSAPARPAGQAAPSLVALRILSVRFRISFPVRTGAPGPLPAVTSACSRR